ncbi:MAG: hypothetical protein JXB88_03165 [Spirochaetales bacterium]|nr:hypothetical protein [Spirochaetales bacterium]
MPENREVRKKAAARFLGTEKTPLMVDDLKDIISGISNADSHKKNIEERDMLEQPACTGEKQKAL